MANRVLRTKGVALTIAQAEPSREFEAQWAKLFAPLLEHKRKAQEANLGQKERVDDGNGPTD
ncbi:MAG: hypothetical protein HY672_03165 [Chloroflexi bacterium]|nr:hypothetical protein [Chloroflexota bacterium]